MIQFFFIIHSIPQLTDFFQFFQVSIPVSNRPKIKLVRIRQKSFQEGMATSTEVVDAEVMLSKVKTAFLLAYYQYDVALINLLSICGIPEAFQQYRVERVTEII